MAHRRASLFVDNRIDEWFRLRRGAPPDRGGGASHVGQGLAFIEGVIAPT